MRQLFRRRQGGNTVRAGKRAGFSGACALLLALLMFLSVSVSAQAAPNDLSELTLMLAQNAADNYRLTDAQGQLIRPRLAPELKGRGSPDEDGVMPDYVGIAGYAALQTDWKVSRFNSFASTPWILPVYREDEAELPNDMIRHKTPVLVVDQYLRAGKGGKYTGMLDVIRLDTMKSCRINVINFVTVPYWTLDLSEAVKYGYCIAIYRSADGHKPMDRKGHRGMLPEGTYVLMCFSNPPKYTSPDTENNPLMGIVFRNKSGNEAQFRTFLFFDPGDLSLVY